MDMTGEKRISASKQAVWDALNDPEVLKVSIPGCDEVTRVSETEFQAKVRLAIGPVKARFSGKVSLSEVDPPNGYTLTGEGNGGVAGFGKGEARVSLREEGNETVVAYTAHASVGGKLAQIGQRLVDSTAKKLTDQFFSNFAAHLSEPGADAPETGDTPAQPAATPPPPPSPEPASAHGTGPWPVSFWIPAVVGLVVLWLINL